MGMLEKSQSQDQGSDSAVRSLQSLVTTLWNEADLCKASPDNTSLFTNTEFWKHPAPSHKLILKGTERLLRAMAQFQVLFWILGLRDPALC